MGKRVICVQLGGPRITYLDLVLKAEVRADAESPRLHALERLLVGDVASHHDVGRHDGWRARDTVATVYEDATTLIERLVDKRL
jgi:hypothetical protein